MSGDKGEFSIKTTSNMAADNIVKDAIRKVLKGGSVSSLLDVGFYDPVANESLRFLVYAIRALHKKGMVITPTAIAKYLNGYTTRGVATAAREELKTIINQLNKPT